MNYGEAVAYRYGNEIKFGIVTAVVTTQDASGEKTILKIMTEPVSGAALEEEIPYDGTDERVLSLSRNYALRDFITGQACYKWAVAEAKKMEKSQV
jgi:hypothetical protein